MESAEISGLLALPKRRRLQIAERLWLSVAEDSTLPVPAEHKKLLRSRLADYRAGRTKAVTHEELLRRVRAK